MKELRIEIAIPSDAVGALSNDLAALLGDQYKGVSTKGGKAPYVEVRVDSPTHEQERQIRILVQEFDTRKRTPEQMMFAQYESIVTDGREAITLDNLEALKIPDNIKKLLIYLYAENALLRMRLG